MQREVEANTTESAKWITIPQAALRVGVSADTIRRRVKSGELPASLFAGAYRIRIADLEEMVGREAA